MHNDPAARIRIAKPYKRIAAERPASRIRRTSALVVLGIFTYRAAYGAPLSAKQFDDLASRCAPGVAPSTLASIAQVESGLEPLAIHDDTTGQTIFPADRTVAILTASTLLKAGHSLDAGLMQINSSNFDRLAMTAIQAFDPCKSIAAAATILSSAYAGGDTRAAEQASLRRAISSYNTGNPERGGDNGYVHKVELASQRTVPPIETEPLEQGTGAPSPKPETDDKNAPPSWDVWGSYEYEESQASPEAAPPQDDAPLPRSGEANAPPPPRPGNDAREPAPYE